MPGRGRRVEQGEATKSVLVGVARELFTEHGFAGTATEEIVQRAKVTRGALYHHFDGKEDLFRAVYEEVESELAERISATASRGADAAAKLRLGLDEFLDACLEPEVQRICLLEAMTILGWEAWYAIDARYALGLLKMGLQACIDEGLLEERPVDVVAHLLLGALIQAALAVGRADDPLAARKQFGDEIHGLVDGLLIPPRPPRPTRRRRNAARG